MAALSPSEFVFPLMLLTFLGQEYFRWWCARVRGCGCAVPCSLYHACPRSPPSSSHLLHFARAAGYRAGSSRTISDSPLITGFRSCTRPGDGLSQTSPLRSPVGLLDRTWLKQSSWRLFWRAGQSEESLFTLFYFTPYTDRPTSGIFDRSAVAFCARRQGHPVPSNPSGFTTFSSGSSRSPASVRSILRIYDTYSIICTDCPYMYIPASIPSIYPSPYEV